MAATLDRIAPRVSAHLGWTWEEIARADAVRAVSQGALPAGQVGRWWTHKGDPAEVDVLGLTGGRVVLAGEARWSTRPFVHRDLQRLRQAAGRAAPLSEDVVFVVWNRGGLHPDVADRGVVHRSPETVLG